MPRQLTLCTLGLLSLFSAIAAGDEVHGDTRDAFVQVCRDDPRYYELSSGQPFIPIGVNICWPRFESDEQQVLATLEGRFAKLSAGGGNFVRIWMSHPFYDIEHRRSGEYDPTKLHRIKAVLALARKRSIRVCSCWSGDTKNRLEPHRQTHIPLQLDLSLHKGSHSVDCTINHTEKVLGAHG